MISQWHRGFLSTHGAPLEGGPAPVHGTVVRIVSESAVDVPTQLSPDTELAQSPSVMAPLAAAEAFIERSQVAAASATLPPPLKQNGSIPVAASIEQPTDLDVTRSSYNPDQTMEEEEEEEDQGSRPSLEEQILQLEEEITRTKAPQAEQNHAEVARSPGAKAPAASASPAKKSGGCCRVFTLAFLSLMLVLVILFVVLFFTPLQHPILTSMRKELHFLEPTRDFILKQVAAAKKMFK